MSRQIVRRLLKTNYVVLGDGITEQYYLTHLKGLKNYKYAIRPSLFAGLTIETAESIIDDLLVGGCDQILYFTDYDTIINQNKVEAFETLKTKYSGHDEVLICETMPSIEYWFLLHYQKTTREFRNADEVFKFLKKHLKDYSKKKDYLANPKWVETLCDNGKLEKAIGNSESVLKAYEKGGGSHFPFSKNHLAFEYFKKHKNE